MLLGNDAIYWGFSLFGIFLQFFVLLRITDDGWLLETRTLAILKSQIDFKWCIYVSMRLFLNSLGKLQLFNHLIRFIISLNKCNTKNSDSLSFYEWTIEDLAAFMAHQQHHLPRSIKTW